VSRKGNTIGQGRARDARGLRRCSFRIPRRIGGGTGRVHRSIRNFAGTVERHIGSTAGLPFADPLGRIRGKGGETRGLCGRPRREPGRTLGE
jgi:hypothetical protein